MTSRRHRLSLDTATEPACQVRLVNDPPRTLWLHNHRAFWLKAALLREPRVGVADVTLHTGRDA